jgi:hypothetical protein
MAHGEDFGVALGFVDDGSAVAGEDVEQVVEVVEQEEFGVVTGWVDDVTADGSVLAYALEHRDDVFLVGIDGLAEPLPEESAVVDGNGVAIAAELMDEFFHLLAKIRRAAGGRATNCHFCRGFDGGWQQRCRGVIYGTSRKVGALLLAGMC